MASSPEPFALEPLGEDALLLRLGDRIDPAINARVHDACAAIVRSRPYWLRDIVPAYASVALYVDPGAFADDADPLAEAARWLRALDLRGTAARLKPRLVELPTRYGGDDAPDLEAVARHAGIDPRTVIARHCGVEYRVAMLGFAPGFPYLLGMDPTLAMPRLATPRTRVAAGSVGIGGEQTGIYPQAGPGGWRIIGRCTLALFDPQRDPPTLLAPGDRIRFVAVDTA